MEDYKNSDNTNKNAAEETNNDDVYGDLARTAWSGNNQGASKQVERGASVDKVGQNEELIFDSLPELIKPVQSPGGEKPAADKPVEKPAESKPTEKITEKAADRSPTSHSPNDAVAAKPAEKTIEQMSLAAQHEQQLVHLAQQHEQQRAHLAQQHEQQRVHLAEKPAESPPSSKPLISPQEYEAWQTLERMDRVGRMSRGNYGY